MLKVSNKKSALVEAPLHVNVPVCLGALIEVESRGSQTWRSKVGSPPNELGVMLVRCAVFRYPRPSELMQYVSQ